MTKDQETVFVGLSGGVDSSVSAKRLIDAGYAVVGVFIKTWHPDFLHCNWEAERLDAMRVAAHLNIPFMTFDAEAIYRDEVAQYMINEYKIGHTPNPDVMCNRYVKFGAFLTYAIAQGATKVATGHYARIQEEDGEYVLYRGIDESKDQSYFLWTLTQEQLSRIHFPVGDSLKQDVRSEAEHAGIPTFAKSDSQGVCFLGEIDMREFLSHYTTIETGDVLNEQGTVIGTHDGAIFYTLGQRHGFIIDTQETASTPHYVISKDIEHNTITVASTPHTVVGKRILLSQVHSIRGTLPATCEAQFRYRQKSFAVSLETTGTNTSLTVLDPAIEMPSIGQSCVLYNRDECLGGGIIEKIYT